MTFFKRKSHENAQNFRVRSKKFYWTIFIFTLRQIQYYLSVFSSELIIKIYIPKKTHIYIPRFSSAYNLCLAELSAFVDAKVVVFFVRSRKKYFFPRDSFRRSLRTFLPYAQPSYVNNIDASSRKKFFSSKNCPK